MNSCYEVKPGQARSERLYNAFRHYAPLDSPNFNDIEPAFRVFGLMPIVAVSMLEIRHFSLYCHDMQPISRHTSAENKQETKIVASHHVLHNGLRCKVAEPFATRAYVEHYHIPASFNDTDLQREILSKSQSIFLSVDSCASSTAQAHY